MFADVTERDRAKKRVSNRMQQHVGVRVAKQATLVRDRDAAHDERTAGN
jgi:hypothetical protein